MPQDATAETRRSQLFKGVAELAILALLRNREQYGLELLDRIRTDAGIELAGGSIYPLLHRLERSGWLRSRWKVAGEFAQPRKYYRLTKSGEAELCALAAVWRGVFGKLAPLVDRELRQ